MVLKLNNQSKEENLRGPESTVKKHTRGKSDYNMGPYSVKIRYRKITET